MAQEVKKVIDYELERKLILLRLKKPIEKKEKIESVQKKAYFEKNEAVYAFEKDVRSLISQYFDVDKSDVAVFVRCKNFGYEIEVKSLAKEVKKVQSL